MRKLRGWLMRFGGLFNKRGKDQDLETEIQSHLELHIEDNLRSGMSPEEARRQAVIRLGGVESTKEAYRDQRSLPWVETVIQDVRYGFRMLLKNPGFTAVAVLTLAIGIGANTAIFSFVNAILLRPLPFKDPERLVMVYENHPGNQWFKHPVAAPVLSEWRRQSTVFEGLGAQQRDEFILSGEAQPEVLRGASLSANVFQFLGVKPVLGRDFRPEEEIHGNHRVVLLSHELWQRRFGGAPDVIGRQIEMNAEPWTVIGVMPPRTVFPDQRSQVWVPLAFTPKQLGARHSHNYKVYGKLKPGVTLDAANAEMQTIANRMAAADEQNRGWGVEVHTLHSVMVGDVRRVLLVLLGAVGLVLLIACANIANLLLARSAGRAREFAIRSALGAGRRKLIHQLLAESFLFCLAGGLGGVLLAAYGLRILVRLSPPDLPRIWEGVYLDGTTLAFTAVATLATGVVFGLIPALQASAPSLAKELTESARGSSSVRRQRLRSALIVGEIAISVVLLVGAGLAVRSFGKLLSQNLGFNPEQVVAMNILLPEKKYPEQGQRERFFNELLASVRALPGVKAAGGVTGLPLSGWSSSYSVDVIGAPPKRAGEVVMASYAQVSPGYFSAMNIPLLQGREFTEYDQTNTAPVLIVDETFARNFNLGTNVIGRKVNIANGTREAEIIGLVKDVKRGSLAEPSQGQFYRSYKQHCWGGLSVIVRTEREAAEVTRSVRAVLQLLDKDQPVENVRTMQQLVVSSVAPQRLSMQLLGAFASAAIVLAAIGLYGVLSYTVLQRTREIGIRTALGAQRADVVSLVLGQGMKLTGVGIAIGLASALGLTHLIRSLLFGIEPTDPLTFVAIPLLLIVVALLACWLPARRAAHVDPMVALRSE